MQDLEGTVISQGARKEKTKKSQGEIPWWSSGYQDLT